jgi:hypothetical protein
MIRAPTTLASASNASFDSGLTRAQPGDALWLELAVNMLKKLCEQGVNKPFPSARIPRSLGK